MDIVGQGVETVKGKINDVVDAGKVHIRIFGEYVTDNYVFIITCSGGRLFFSGSNPGIMTYEAVVDNEVCDAGTGSVNCDAIFTGDATVVGEPYLVYVTKDEKGKDVIEHFEDEPLSLTIGYDEELLKKAGLGLGAADDISFYCYNENLCGYEKLDSVIDKETMEVTAVISKSGEYLLAVPYGSKDYNEGEKTVSANTLSVMKIGDSGYVVKYTGTVSYNGVQHIQQGVRANKSKCTDIEVHLFGPDGSEVDSDYYKLKFKNNKNVNGVKEPYFTIKLKGKVDKGIKTVFKDIRVPFIIEPFDLGTIFIDHDGLYDTATGMKIKNHII